MTQKLTMRSDTIMLEKTNHPRLPGNWNLNCALLLFYRDKLLILIAPTQLAIVI